MRVLVEVKVRVRLDKLLLPSYEVEKVGLSAWMSQYVGATLLKE